MGHVINIHNNRQKIDLEIGHYKIDIIGGWRVELGQFSIQFTNNQSGQRVDCKRYSLPIQSYVQGKRAKRVFSVEIVEQGIYQVEFLNSESLKVKRTNLFFAGLFQEPISSEQISVYIY